MHTYLNFFTGKKWHAEITMYVVCGEKTRTSHLLIVLVFSLFSCFHYPLRQLFFTIDIYMSYHYTYMSEYSKTPDIL